MSTPEEYRRRAQEAEHMASRLPEGFERADHLRRAAAWRDIAQLLEEQARRTGSS